MTGPTDEAPPQPRPCPVCWTLDPSTFPGDWWEFGTWCTDCMALYDRLVAVNGDDEGPSPVELVAALDLGELRRAAALAIELTSDLREALGQAEYLRAECERMDPHDRRWRRLT